MKFAGAYAYFCDDNTLQRIESAPETVLTNLDAMATAILEMRVVQLKKIADRCPHCSGKGIR